MGARLVAVGGPLGGKVFALSEQEDFSIGREPSSRLALNDPSVSRRHCVIRGKDEEWTVHDLDSRNGTFVNELPVRERLLRHGDQVKVGESLLLFLSQEQETAPAEVAVPPAEDCVVTRSITRLRAEDAVYLHPQPVPDAGRPPGRPSRNFNALLKICMALSSIQERETLERRLLEGIFEVVPAERGQIYLVGESEEGLASGFSLQRDPGRAAPVPASRTIVDRVLKERDAILCNDVLRSEAFGEAESLIASESRSLLAVPMVLFDRVFGVIYADTTDPRVRFDEDHLQLLMAIAGSAAIALDNALRLERLQGENRRLQAEINIEHNMVGESPRMAEVYKFVGKVASKETTLLLRGESGTGKELVARAIHQNSPRREKPFVAINCAALAETLLESELFGHEKGAFTGAIAQKRGKLEGADGGTLFLDEVGELPPSIQVKLLRVLQEREFERVGGTRPIKVDIRLITATNKDLEEAIKAGAFRQDLYFRLNVVSFTMPPLRERREDIPLLASYFAARFSQKSGRRVLGISPEARGCLRRYDWPGNVRELENAIEHAVVLGSSDLILPEDLPEAVLEVRPSEGGSITRYHNALLAVKKKLILDALDRTRGNYTEAAALLGLHPNYLHRLASNMNLRVELKRSSAGGHSTS